MKRNRILLINDHVHFGGGGDAVFYLEKEFLEKNNYEVFVYTWGNDSTDTDEHIIVCREPKSLLKKKYAKFLRSRYLALHFRKVLKKINPDIIHIHLVSKYPLAIYSELRGYKVIQTLHGPNLFCATSWGCLRKNSSPCEMGIGLKCYSRGCSSLFNMFLYSLLYKRLFSLLRKNISLFHCPSLNIYSTAYRLNLGKLKYLPLGIDNRFINNNDRLVKYDRPTVLFVGAIAEVKGVEYLYKAFKKTLSRIPNAQLLIAGRGHLEGKLKEWVAIDGLKDNVIFLGFQNRENIHELYKKVHVFVLPSIWQEQFGLVGPEALASECPCIGSNIGGIPEWLHNNEWGYLVTARDVDDLSDKIVYVLENKSIADNFGKTGRRFVLREYSPKQYLNGLLDMFNTI